MRKRGEGEKMGRERERVGFRESKREKVVSNGFMVITANTPNHHGTNSHEIFFYQT